MSTGCRQIHRQSEPLTVITLEAEVKLTVKLTLRCTLTGCRASLRRLNQILWNDIGCFKYYYFYKLYKLKLFAKYNKRYLLKIYWRLIGINETIMQ